MNKRTRKYAIKMIKKFNTISTSDMDDDSKEEAFDEVWLNIPNEYNIDEVASEINKHYNGSKYGV